MVPSIGGVTQRQMIEGEKGEAQEVGGSITRYMIAASGIGTRYQ